jgi:uncharacterized protein (TIGR02266 family)
MESMMNQRRHPRADMPIVVEYRVASYEQFLSEYAANLSVGGIFIRTDEPCVLGATIFFQFKLDAGSTLIEGMGKVVHVSEDGEAGMGVEFLELADDSREIIAEIVADRLSRI